MAHEKVWHRCEAICMIPRVFYLAALDVSRGTASTQILDRLLFFRTFQNISKINASANQAGFDSTDRNTQRTSNIGKRTPANDSGGLASAICSPLGARPRCLVICVVTPLSSRNFGFSAGIVATVARNSSRRLRLASLSRSAAWRDFFSAADPSHEGSG